MTEKLSAEPTPRPPDTTIDASVSSGRSPPTIGSRLVKDSGRDMVATEAVYAQEPSPFDCGHEIMIDGAQCVRFGKDILVNVATANHEAGYQWLARHCGDRFRLHRVYRMTDNHIDSIILPLRPGKLLLREPKYLDMLPAPLSPMLMRGHPLQRKARLAAGFPEDFLDQLDAWQPGSPGY